MTRIDSLACIPLGASVIVARLIEPRRGLPGQYRACPLPGHSRFYLCKGRVRLTLFARTFLLLALVSCPFPEAAVADDSLEEIVVSAKRRDVSLADISAAVGAVDTDAAGPVILATDALAEVPGVFLQQTTPGQGTAIVRGLRGSSVLHVVDGARLNNAIFRSAPTQYAALVPVTSIERVEVLRGSSTSLYGSDAVGGIVEFVTRVPAFDSADTASRGSFYVGHESANSSQTARGLLEAGNERVAASVSLEYQDNGDRRVGGGDRIGPSGFESRGGRLALSLTPEIGGSWLFDVQHLEQPSTPRIDELVPGFGQAEASSSEFFFAPNRRTFSRIRYTNDGGPWNLDWRAEVSWQKIDDDRITRDLDAPERRIERNSSELLAALVTAAGSLGDGGWIAGAEIYTDKVRSSRESEDIATGERQTVTSRFPDGSTLDQAALFFNADLALAEAHTLSGGVRWTAVDVELAATALTPATSVRVSDFSGDLGWLYRLSDQWQLVANVAWGFRAPNVFDLGTLGNRPGNRFNVPNPSLDSEQVLHGDVGLRHLNDGWRLELFAFALDYDDRITSVSTGDVTPEGRDIVTSVNAATSSIYGLEFSAALTLGERLDLQAIVNYTRGEDRIGGEREPADRIPPLSGRLRADFAATDTLDLAAWVRLADNQDRLSSRDIRDVRIDPNGTPGWGSVGAEAVWHPADRWQLSFGIDNLLDRRYRQHGSGVDAPGRNLQLSALYSW